MNTRPHVNENEIYSQRIKEEKSMEKKFNLLFPLEKEVSLGEGTSRIYGTMEILKMIIGVLSKLVSAFVNEFTMHL